MSSGALLYFPMVLDNFFCRMRKVVSTVSLLQQLSESSC